MKVCIAGAGAIGSALAARLSHSRNHQISVYARGRTLVALRERGVYLTDLEGEHHARVRASDSAADLGHQDVIFICVKADSVAAILEKIRPMIAPATCVIPVINGLPWWYFQSGPTGQTLPPDPFPEHQKLLQMLNISHICGCVTFMTAQTTAAGMAVSQNPHLMILGEPDNSPSSRSEAIRQLIEDAGIEARTTCDIRDQVWIKIIANLTSNPLSVISGATLDQIYSHPLLAPLTRKMLDEVLLTAAAYGARIPFTPSRIMEMGAGMGMVRTSMLQDYQQQRPLELATIGDAIVTLASQMGLAMDTTRHVLNMARFLSTTDRQPSVTAEPPVSISASI